MSNRNHIESHGSNTKEENSMSNRGKKSDWGENDDDDTNIDTEVEGNERINDIEELEVTKEKLNEKERKK